MDGRALLFHAPEEGEDGFALLLLIVGVGLDVEVVVGEQGVGIGVGGGAIGEVDVAFADVGEPDGGSEVVVIVVLGPDRFVDDIPGVNAPLVARGDRANVIGENGDCVFGSDGLLEPGRVVLVPAEIVAAHEEMVGFGEVGKEIGLGEVEAVGSWMGGGPLHLIFRNQDRALVEDERSEVKVVELRIGDGGAEKERFGEGEIAEARYGRGRLLGERESGEGGARDLEEIAAMHGGRE